MAQRNRKTVPAAATNTSGRIPRKQITGSNRRAQDWLDTRPTWGFQVLDHEVDGSWSWGFDRQRLLKLMAFLSEMEKRTWGEIRRDMTGGRRRGEMHKFIPVASLCKEAQDRLADVELDDQDRLFRFRLGNLQRLWGIMLPDESTFYVLWWDETHQVCPSADN